MKPKSENQPKKHDLTGLQKKGKVWFHWLDYQAIRLSLVGFRPGLRAGDVVVLLESLDTTVEYRVYLMHYVKGNLFHALVRMVGK